jgi:hypothetical protein
MIPTSSHRYDELLASTGLSKNAADELAGYFLNEQSL